RVPDIMARSGAKLVEVGTTNRTHLDDYAKAVSHKTRVLLKVHRSNFKVSGFTADVSPSEVAQLAHASGAAALFDLGSGLLMDLAPWYLSGEPTVREAVASGVDLVVFSGDKLLGGPQAGILVGTRAVIEACRKDPTARAVRADKLTLAALEATLRLYRAPETARRDIPVLRMLTKSLEEIRHEGETLAKDIGAEASLIPGESEVGGGSFPGTTLKTWLVRIAVSHLSADGLSDRLRAASPPVITRIADGHVVLDPRTLSPGEIPLTARVLRSALDA
ncbi:MAG TPA: L-seryl-tRNA(Sec) selenium transferase, partial [Gemmatimonadales bacterium]|nr:L-seryl-tRNA(Sec) selenium transferase [Gemmatimonadales bacterium]